MKLFLSFKLILSTKRRWYIIIIIRRIAIGRLICRYWISTANTATCTTKYNQSYESNNSHYYYSYNSRNSITHSWSIALRVRIIRVIRWTVIASRIISSTTITWAIARWRITRSAITITRTSTTWSTAAWASTSSSLLIRNSKKEKYY